MDAPKKKPLITANQVTTARLLAMPLLPWLVYEGPRTGWIWALIIGAIIGATDYVDGYLARKHGPTILGSLLDPIADKVSIAAFYLPLVAMGVIPAWAVAVLFTREFLVTALRSCFALRGLTMKTSYLAKVKTWMQMQGIGLVLLLILVDRQIMLGILGASVALPILVAGIVAIRSKRFFKSAFVMAGLTSVLFSLYMWTSLSTTIAAAVWIMAGITWLSGADYLIVGLPQLRAAGDFSKADAVRILGSLVLPVAVTAAIVYTEMRWIPVFIMAMELAVSGLDNLLAVHKKSAGAMVWATRTWTVAALCGFAAYAGTSEYKDWALPAVAAALGISVIGSALEFWRGRDYYIDEKHRDTLA